MVLPYKDSKPLGAADFYFAINATFRFILNRYGKTGLINYWNDLGSQYFASVSCIWKERGLAGVEQYWRAFFAAEPGAEVDILSEKDYLMLKVRVCPAIRHLCDNKREPVSCFCEHCYYVNEAIAEPADLTVRVQGGNGRCQQTFFKRESAPPPQDFSQIEEAG